MVTFHNKYSKNPTVSLNTLCKSCAKIAFCSYELIFTFLYAGSSTQNANEQFISCIHMSFVDFALHPTPQQQKNPADAKAGLKKLNLG
jgi:hypothetical protein